MAVIYTEKFTEEELSEEKEHIQVVGITNDAVVATAVLVPEGLDCKMQRVVVDENLVNKGIGSKKSSVQPGSKFPGSSLDRFEANKIRQIRETGCFDTRKIGVNAE